MRCSACGGTRYDGCIRHEPWCGFYLPSDMFRTHPDLLAWDAEVSRGWPDRMWHDPPASPTLS